MINYINLLPFKIYAKKLNLHFKTTYPAKLNRDFLFKRIDAGFISSFAGFDAFLSHKNAPLGIISKGAVWSVLLLPNEAKDDYQSASSNALSKALGLSGEILIGDRALKLHYKNKNKANFTDLGQIWWEKQNLPFTFGLLCINAKRALYQKIAKNFAKTPIKIPQYILQSVSKEHQIPPKYIISYLKQIHYAMGTKEIAGLRRFYRICRLKRISRPKRF